MRNGQTIESYVPARLDALPWSSWHWLIVVSLGATWILDGLEVTLAGALGGVLTRHETLGLSDAQVGASATFYLAGAVIGALLFGYGTDRFGRKKLFFITVAVYLIGTALSGFSWNFWSYALFRAITGAGIGGEYAAINSAIDELIPARVRGRVDLIINGSYWVGAAMGARCDAGAARFALHSDLARMAMRIWNRRGSGINRDFLSPLDSGESALVDDSRAESRSGRDRRGRGTKDWCEAEYGSNGVLEYWICFATHHSTLQHSITPVRIRTRTHTPWREIWNAIVHEHRRRSFLAFVLMSTQAFFYNAIFFTYALVLMRFYSVPEQDVGRLPSAVRAWKCARAAAAWASVRYDRAQTNDYPDVCARRSIARGDWLAFSRRIADRANANACVDNYLFRRFGGRQFRLPDRERDFSLGNSRNGDRDFLCTWNTGWRRRRAAAVRLDHRHGIEHSIIHRIFGGGGVNDFCGGDGSMDWRGRRATLARAHRRTVVEQRAVGLITVCGRAGSPLHAV